MSMTTQAVPAIATRPGKRDAARMQAASSPGLT